MKYNGDFLRNKHEAISAKRSGDFERALLHIDNCLEIEPLAYDLLFDKEEVLLRMGRFQESEAMCVRLTSEVVTADGFKSHRRLALAAKKLRRYEQALAHLERCLQIDPTLFGLLDDKAHILLELGRFRESKDIFSQMLSYDSGHIFSLHGYYRCARKLGERICNDDVKKLEYLAQNNSLSSHERALVKECRNDDADILAFSNSMLFRSTKRRDIYNIHKPT